MDEPITPDNTKVLRIMDDFREFIESSNLQTSSGTGSISYRQRSVIPINLSHSGSTIKTPSKKRSYSSSCSEILNKAQLTQLEMKHSSEEKAHKLARIDLESRNEKLLSENLQLKDKCQTLRFRVKEVTVQAIDAQDKLQEVRGTKITDKEKLEELVVKLQAEKQALESKLHFNLSKLDVMNRSVQNQNEKLSGENVAMEEKLEEVMIQLQQKSQRVAKLTEELKTHHECESALRSYRIEIQDLEARLRRASEAEQMAIVMKEDLSRLRMLEQEVLKLRESNEQYRENEENIQLMKEKLLAAETKQERAEMRMKSASLIELENKELIAQLDEAKRKELHASDSKDTLAKVTELQKKELTLTCENGEIKSELASCRRKCEFLKQSMKEMEQKVSEKNDSSVLLQTQIRHLQKRALLLAGERNSLRGILQSYDSELTSTSQADQLMKRAQTAETSNEKLHVRLDETQKELQDSIKVVMQLKAAVKEHEYTVGDLKKQLEENGSRGNKDVVIDSLRKTVEEMEIERSELQKEKDRLKSWIESRMMSGDYDPSKTRVLHFHMNPADLAHSKSRTDVEDLRAQCTKLREKLHKIEENLDVTTTSVMCEDNKDLQSKLDASELRNQRLKEVFSKKIQEFRKACYTLTGFRIDYTVDGQFKLASMYAEHEEDYLLFKLDSSGSMQLLETEYSKSLSSLINLHLHHQNSIPMFLSSITADLFSQQTMM